MKPVTCYLDSSGTILTLAGDWQPVCEALGRPVMTKGESVISLYPANRQGSLKDDLGNLAADRMTLVDASFLAVPRPDHAGGGEYVFLRFERDESGRSAIKGTGGLFPPLRTCMYCEQVNAYANGSRWEPEGWREPSSDDLENLLLSHGVCPHCYETDFKHQIAALNNAANK